MASQQASKKDTKMEETHSEEPKVLKLAQLFEELGKDSDKATEEGGAHKFEHNDSVEDIGKYRAQAQQNSMEAIRGAEERYEKAKKAALGEYPKDDTKQPADGGKKDIHGATGHSVKVKDRAAELTGRGGDQQGYEKEKNAALGELLKDAKQPKDQAQGGGKKGTDETTGHFVMDRANEGGKKDTTEQHMEFTAGQETAAKQGGKKDTTSQGEHYMDAAAGEEPDHLEGQRGSDYTTAAKDTIVTVGKTVIDYTKQAAEQAKGVAANTGGPAIHYIGEKAVGVKDTAVNVGKSAAGTTAEIGKSAAGYAGAKAVQAKDVVVETGLLAAHYTLQKAAQVTDVSADVGNKAVEHSEEKTGEVKQEKLQRKEEAQEHAAKQQKIQKKEEAQEHAAKQEKIQKNEEQEKFQKKEEAQEHAAKTKSQPSQGKDAPKFDEYKEELEQSGPEAESHPGKQGSSLMGAVGEAFYEIAQTTKKMVSKL